MKYFDNISTAEEIKKQFRAYCVKRLPLPRPADWQSVNQHHGGVQLFF